MTIAGRGSRIIGGSLQSELTREEVLEIVLTQKPWLVPASVIEHEVRKFLAKA